MVFESVTTPIFGALDGLLNPFIQTLGPMLTIVVIAIILAFIITIANKLLVDQDRLQYLQKEMKSFQQEMNEARKSNDPKALEKMQKKQMEFMDIQKEMMTNSFKPMIVTFIPILIVFGWIGANDILNNLIITLPSFVYYVLLVPLWHAIPFYGGAPAEPMSITWLGWYILCSFAFSQIFRKLMGLKSGGM
jgi:uncharacterized membrane protein (DUF106 family)